MNRKLLPWVLAVCFDLAAVWLAGLYATSLGENALLRDRLRLAEVESQHLRNQLEAERIVERRALADALGQAPATTSQGAQAQPQSAGK